MSINKENFFKNIKSKLFKSMKQTQVDGINFLLNVWEEKFSDYPIEYLSYCLATAYHETAQTMQPIEEYGRGKTKLYGKPTGPYNKIYDGRGYVQLTWLANYQKAQEKLKKLYNIDYDLVKNPEKAMIPQVAALIMFQGCIDGWFTGKKLSNYFDNKEDPVNARRIINGTDKASTIAGYYKIFKAALDE